MNLEQFTLLCKVHNETAEGTFVDVFIDDATGETVFVVLSSRFNQPKMYWGSVEVLEDALTRFEPGEFFADDVRDQVLEMMCESTTERLT